jgi:anti-sigma B factor antagonist
MSALMGGGSSPANVNGFNVEENWFERVVVLAASGEVDMLTAPQLIEAVDDAFAQVPAALIIDLTRVAYLASAGLNALLTAHKKASGSSIRFGVVADGPATSKPITVTGIDLRLTLYPSINDALRDVQLSDSP